MCGSFSKALLIFFSDIRTFQIVINQALVVHGISILYAHDLLRGHDLL